MPVAPGQQAPEHRAEIPAALRQQVFMARRMFAIAPALQETRLDQAVEAPAENVGRDLQALLELVEAGETLKGVPKDQHRPPIAYPVQAAGDGALHIGEALALHDRSPCHYHDESHICLLLS